MTKKRKSIVEKHVLFPEHAKINEKEKKDLFEKYNISENELPKIRKDDPAIISLNVKAGDVIKILRNSPTAGESLFYRCVIDV